MFFDPESTKLPPGFAQWKVLAYASYALVSKRRAVSAVPMIKNDSRPLPTPLLYRARPSESTSLDRRYTVLGVATNDFPPSTNHEALVKAIERANSTGDAIRLLAGTHLTKPGLRLLTPIGANGLVMTGPKPGTLVKPARIQRPDDSIGV